MSRGKTFICKVCGDNFTSTKSCKNRTPKYCSNKCYSETLKKYKECKECNKKFADYTKSLFCSRDCQIKNRTGKPLSEEWKKALSEGRKKSIKCRGENLYNWKGGNETRRILSLFKELKDFESIQISIQDGGRTLKLFLD